MAYDSTTKPISLPNLTDTVLKLSVLGNAQQRITFLSHAIATLLMQVANKQDYMSLETFLVPQHLVGIVILCHVSSNTNRTDIFDMSVTCW